MKPFFASMYDADFDIRMGLHYGEAVLGSLGSIGHERLTAVGDVFNVASRVETANKDAGTQLLISAALQEIVRDSVEVADFVRVRPRGTTEPNPPAVSSPEASPTPANRPCRNLVAAAGVREPLTFAVIPRSAPDGSQYNNPRHRQQKAERGGTKSGVF
jgi:hypothetical protein